jgi:hypothetical protein
MDPLGVRLDADDLGAPEFPVRHAFASDRTETHAVERSLGLPHATAPTPALPDLPEPDEIEGDPDDRAYLVGDWYAPTPSRPLHSTRCVATAARTGERCRRWAVIGFERCPKHSGYGKLANLTEYRERVIERARLDLLRGAPYAVESLVEMARDREINPAVRLKASESVLDRIGVKGGTDVTVTVQAEGASPAEIIRGRLERLAAASAALSAAEAPPAGESEILDAELLPEEDTDG